MYREYAGPGEFGNMIRSKLILWLKNRLYKTGRQEKEDVPVILEIPKEYLRW